MKQYLDLLRHVLESGVRKEDRTGTGTLSVFGHQMRFDLQAGFPLVTTKRVWFKGLAVEMLWFIRGETNVRFLHEHGVHIWDEWADPEGELGPVYGKQWRDWEAPDGRHIDQLLETIEALKTNPYSRRHVVSAWNVADLDKMALHPCHVIFQFNVSPPARDGDKKILSTFLYIRSNDLFLGAPFNIAQYALLTHLVAQQVDMMPGELIYSIGDAHIYLNHVDQVREQLNRYPHKLPRILIDYKSSIADYNLEDFTVLDYNPDPSIKAPVSV